MARTNTARTLPTERTHGGALVRVPTDEQRLRRSVMSCMLWEDEFYEDGQSVYKRIAALVPNVAPEAVAKMAVEARTTGNLRHAPLMLVREMARHKSHRPLVRETLAQVVQRADELAEFLAMYWKDGKQPLAASVKKGLADAFPKFNAYQLAKYNRDEVIKLRDVLFLCHAVPKSDEQAAVWKQLIDGTLESPDTWEVELSAGKAPKKQSWERLLSEQKLGALALIRNLRNMEQAGVDQSMIRRALAEMRTERVLPFRFVAAAQHAKRYEAELSDAMVRCAAALPKLPGHTVLVVDVSGSMYSAGNISKKSDMTRVHAACALAALAREQCSTVDIYATAGSDLGQKHSTQLVPNRRGLPLADAIYHLSAPLGGGGIFLKQSLDWIWQDRGERMADRVVVFTDGQDTDRSAKGTTNVRQIAKEQYIINVASAKNGIGYGPWTNLDGFSEHVLDYIRVFEQGQ